MNARGGPRHPGGSRPGPSQPISSHHRRVCSVLLALAEAPFTQPSPKMALVRHTAHEDSEPVCGDAVGSLCSSSRAMRAHFVPQWVL